MVANLDHFKNNEKIIIDDKMVEASQKFGFKMVRTIPKPNNSAHFVCLDFEWLGP